MNQASERNLGLYAIRLLPPSHGGHGPAIAGRVEHVLSGRCHDFADGAALLAFLLSERECESACEQQYRPPAVQKAARRP
jgi:hypothetical protein